ncbi:hypothetical protein G6L37_04225 [Agrobacterium rubi]|nr:hypothetical protein [Agrobacterium rubi]NTF24558.1 hypothetical protein [Agrobacterium rubi]
MEYESYKQHLEALSDGIAVVVNDWLSLAGGVLETLEIACVGESVDIQILQDVKASFSAEATFLKGLPDRIEEYRKAIKGLRQFYEPATIAPLAAISTEEPSKGGWLFGIKRTPAVSSIEPPALSDPDIHRDQRAFIDAKTLLSALDTSLDNIKAQIVRIGDESDEAAYGYKTEVVALNADIRQAKSDNRKREARRFFLEEAVGMLTDRATQLSLHARVVGRLHSSEYLENPFED